MDSKNLNHVKEIVLACLAVLFGAYSLSLGFNGAVVLGVLGFLGTLVGVVAVSKKTS